MGKIQFCPMEGGNGLEIGWRKNNMCNLIGPPQLHAGMNGMGSMDITPCMLLLVLALSG